MTHHHSRPKNTLRYDDEPAVVKVTGEDVRDTESTAGTGTTEDDASDPKSAQVASCDDQDDPEMNSSDIESSQEDRDDDPSGLEEKRRYMAELDQIVCATLLSIIKSGKATPGHLNCARQYLKDKGFTLPELAKRERMSGDTEFLEELELPFGNA